MVFPKKNFFFANTAKSNSQTDIFYVYHNKTRDQSFTTGMRVEKQQRLRWFYPRIDALCTGAMGGRLFHVPCNVEQIEIVNI